MSNLFNFSDNDNNMKKKNAAVMPQKTNSTKTQITGATMSKSAKIVVVTSGKGGVGKTTTSASFATGLALRGHKTVVIDFDIGLRNLDLIMGC